eukprot:scaffold1704_cov100-Isochrysis_galbana.AAC.7
MSTTGGGKRVFAALCGRVEAPNTAACGLRGAAVTVRHVRCTAAILVGRFGVLAIWERARDSWAFAARRRRSAFPPSRRAATLPACSTQSLDFCPCRRLGPRLRGACWPGRWGTCATPIPTGTAPAGWNGRESGAWTSWSDDCVRRRPQWWPRWSRPAVAAPSSTKCRAACAGLTGSPRPPLRAAFGTGAARCGAGAGLRGA